MILLQMNEATSAVYTDCTCPPDYIQESEHGMNYSLVCTRKSRCECQYLNNTYMVFSFRNILRNYCDKICIFI